MWGISESKGGLFVVRSSWTRVGVISPDSALLLDFSCTSCQWEDCIMYFCIAMRHDID
jgi:hypothetical protein